MIVIVRCKVRFHVIGRLSIALLDRPFATKYKLGAKQFLRLRNEYLRKDKKMNDEVYFCRPRYENKQFILMSLIFNNQQGSIFDFAKGFLAIVEMV